MVHAAGIAEDGAVPGVQGFVSVRNEKKLGALYICGSERVPVGEEVVVWAYASQTDVFAPTQIFFEPEGVTLKVRLSHCIPVHGLSHEHIPELHTPFKEQSIALVQVAEMPVRGRISTRTRIWGGGVLNKDLPGGPLAT